MPRVTKTPQERKREILAAALELFLKKGYENVSVGEIVEKVGVAHGLFYYYFKSKEEVYRAAMEQYADDCTADLIGIIQGPAAIREKIGEILSYMTGLIATGEHALMDPSSLPEHLDMDNWLSLHVTQSLIDPVAQLLEELNEKGLIAVRQPDIAATFVVFGIFGLIHGNPSHSHDPAFFASGEAVRIIASVLGLTAEQLLNI